jgi:hypothetical protein
MITVFQSFRLDTKSVSIATALKNTEQQKSAAHALQPAGRILRGSAYGARYF